MPILCSSETQRTSLRAPSVPSGVGRNLGTMNSEMPLVPAGAPSQAGQDEMDDVVGQVVLAEGDEDLLCR